MLWPLILHSLWCREHFQISSFHNIGFVAKKQHKLQICARVVQTYNAKIHKAFLTFVHQEATNTEFVPCVQISLFH